LQDVLKPFGQHFKKFHDFQKMRAANSQLGSTVNIYGIIYEKTADTWNTKQNAKIHEKIKIIEYFPVQMS
jgi:hypothetical protein